MPERSGHRGYIGARPLNGSRTPQHVQNIVVRDYAKRKNLQYLLSAVEHIMPGSYMILEDLLDDLPKLEGIISATAFSCYRPTKLDAVRSTTACWARDATCMPRWKKFRWHQRTISGLSRISYGAEIRHRFVMMSWWAALRL